MKHLIILTSLIVLMTMFSCNPCKDVDCGQGTCDKADGSCLCNPGWEKDASGKCTVEDKCFNKDCGHGYCDENYPDCLCDPGYELNPISRKCDVEMRAKYIGTWRGGCSGSSFIHDMVITPSPTDVTKVIITNLGGFSCDGSPLVATGSVLSGSINTIYTDCPSVTISPSISNNYLYINVPLTMNGGYDVYVNGNHYYCSVAYIKL